MTTAWLPLVSWLAFTLASPPARAQEAGTAPSAEDRLLEVDTELGAEEWQQRAEEKIRELPVEPEDYSVVGAKHPQKLSQSPAAISVLDEDDIHTYTVSTLEELLRLVPGVDTVWYSPGYRAVGMRGFFPVGAVNVLVLVDGREVNSNFMGGVLWNLLPISLDDIKRIEVIRGPGSALYGANAFSGVINIITKDPNEEKRAEAISEVGGYGSELGTLFFKAKGAFIRPRFRLKVSADYNEAKSLGNPGELASRFTRGYLKSTYDLSGNARVNLDASVLQGRSRYYAAVGETPAQDILEANVHLYGNWDRLNFRFAFDRFNLKLGIDTPLVPAEMIRSLFGGDYPIEGKANNIDAGAEYSVYLGQDNRLTFGSGYLLNTFESPSLIRTHNQENRLGAYFQDEWALLPSLNLVAGLRFDYNSQTEEDYSPRLALVYSPLLNHTLRASFARAFRKPTFLEYGMGLKAFQDLGPVLNPDIGRVLYNPDLGNEHVNSFELGYNTLLFRRLTLGAALYYNQYRDIIVFRNLVFENRHQYIDSVGGELSLELIINPKLRGFLNQAVLRGFDRSPGGEFKDQIRRFSPYKTNLGINYRPLPGISLSLIGNLIGPKRESILDPDQAMLANDTLLIKLPAQFLLGFRASYSFLRDHAEVGLKVFNLLDDNGRQYPGGDWNYDLNGDGQNEETNFAGEPLQRILTGFVRLSW
ncbi:MAG: TonB-dependent receptor [bacterium]|nr:TonB-dependent receptor [bacterium]